MCQSLSLAVAYSCLHVLAKWHTELSFDSLMTCPCCAGLLHLTLGSTQLRHSAVHSFTPEVGPLSGGTVIEFQVSSDVLTKPIIN